MLYQIVNEIVFSSSFLVCSFEDIKTRSILKEISTLFADYPEYPTLQLRLYQTIVEDQHFRCYPFILCFPW